MVFKNFRFQIIVRVAVLLLTVSLLAWCLVDARYLRSIYLGVGVIILVVEFIWYVDRFNRDVRSFLISLQQRDFTTHYQSKGRSKSFDELYETLNRISEVFKAISVEKEIQFRYLEMMVEHLRVGILSVDEAGKINLANQALKDILQKSVIMNIRSLESVDPELAHTITSIRSGETRLVKLRVNNELLQLSIHAAEFRLEDRYHKLISMQNIRNELDTREMEAWQKLIRVLTHEIMNSVSPIISLSETMHGLVRQNNASLRGEPDLNQTLDKGLEAIRTRSQGLYNFTQSYRKLTGVPKLTLIQTNLGDIVARVVTLLHGRLQERGVTLKVSAADVPVVADPELMEQVLINLLLNALDALSETSEPLVEISAFRNEKGIACLTIRDNGEGMDEPTAEKIFIPFFTTRKNGSGIGLALTRQILQLHRGDVHFTTTRGKGTEFIVTL